MGSPIVALEAIVGIPNGYKKSTWDFPDLPKKYN
jgi:hypothetical protein